MKTIEMAGLSVEEKPLHALIYGLAGCGKTDFVKNLPKPMLVLDMDNKYEPLMGIEGIELIPFHMNEPADAKLLIPKIWQIWQGAKKDPKWASIVIDSITAIDRMLERYTVIMSGKGKTADARATLQEYGDMKRWYRTFFPSIRTAVDKNVVILAHEQSKEGKEGELLSIRPFITGKMGDELCSIFQHTFHLEHIPGANERWRLNYRKHGKFVCASSVFSEGTGYIEYGRGENGYEKLIEVMKESN